MNDRGLDAAERTVNNNTSTVKCSTRPYTARAFYYPARQLAPIANSEVELTLFVKSNYHLRVPSPPCPQHKHYSQRSVNFLGFPLTTRCPFGKKGWSGRSALAMQSTPYNMRNIETISEKPEVLQASSTSSYSPPLVLSPRRLDAATE